MKVKDLLGDSYSIPVETNQVIKAMLNKVAKELFYNTHYSQGYEAITREGIPIGNKVNEVFFLQQGEQNDIFSPLNNNINGNISNGSTNIQASCLFNEHEIKRVVTNDLDLQDIYDRMVKNLRISLLKARRDKFIGVLTSYLKSYNVKVVKGSKLTDIASVTKLGFQVPTNEYNVSKRETQSFDSDIICLGDFNKLGKVFNEHETPFIRWLQGNCIIEKNLPTNVNGVEVAPDMIMFDRRALKILVNDTQFSYFFNPNSLTYTITYTENIIIATNTTANVCVLKEEQNPNSMGKSYMLEPSYSYYTLNDFLPYEEEVNDGEVTEPKEKKKGE